MMAGTGNAPGNFPNPGRNPLFTIGTSQDIAVMTEQNR